MWRLDRGMPKFVGHATSHAIMLAVAAELRLISLTDVSFFAWRLVLREADGLRTRMTEVAASKAMACSSKVLESCPQRWLAFSIIEP